MRGRDVDPEDVTAALVQVARDLAGTAAAIADQPIARKPREPVEYFAVKWFLCQLAEDAASVFVSDAVVVGCERSRIVGLGVSVLRRGERICHRLAQRAVIS